MITKHLPLSVPTAQGHQAQERQHSQTTKTQTPTPVLNDVFPPSDYPNVKTHDVIYSISAPAELSTTYSDLTGRFPLQSSRGNNYIFVAYHPDANAILVEPLKNRQAATIAAAWTTITNRLKNAAMKPNTWIMDNECSSDLKTL